MKWTAAIVLITTFLLTGCAVAPGMKMTGDSVSPKGVEMIPVTAELVAKQVKSGQAEAFSTKKLTSLSQGKKGYVYRIGPHDILSIIVWDHPELTIPAGEFRSPESAGHLVTDDGTIFYPYVGTVQVAGKTVSEVRTILTRMIAEKIVNPQLDVKVITYRSQKAYIVGEVAEPGPQPITDQPLSIIQAINLSGDVKREADMANVTLSRNGETFNIDLLAMYKDGDMANNILLENDDILYIPDISQQKVFVLGEVTRPSSLLMNKGRMSLSEAIADAGGVNNVTANTDRIFVIRREIDRTNIYHLDGSSPDALILGDQFELRPRDVVYVETAGITRWNRVIEQILPTVQLLNDASATDFPLFKGGGAR